MIHVTIIPILKDNYVYLLKADNGETAVIDPGDAAPVLEAVAGQGINTLDYVINTHHHWDHTDGNAQVIAATKAKLVAPRAELGLIDGVDRPLSAGDKFIFGEEYVKIIETPGHTMGHMCLYFPKSKLLFTGDTLFLMGCGRLFEGTPAHMFDSFQKLKTLPDDVRVYCGHEYTLLGAKFGLRYAPENKDIQARFENIKKRRARKQPTVPALLGEEKATNLFMLAGSVEEFADLRAKRDGFKI
jgi:hydroxyacylglutathione hydrolase